MSTAVETAVEIEQIIAQIRFRMESHDWTRMLPCGTEITEVPSQLLYDLLAYIESPTPPEAQK